MPRLKRPRHLADLPLIKGFRPIWLQARLREAVVLRLEEYESIRLIDYEKLNQEQAAELMKVSRPTITRIYEEARHKLSIALVEGRSLLIEGGEVDYSKQMYYCEDCQTRFSAVESSELCPECGSGKVLNLNDCFLRGCRRCRRCK